VAYSSCLACSICISEFTPGEELRLLPRCGHMFHHDCLLPWLMEAKSICPLCQTKVIEEDTNDNGNNNDNGIVSDDHDHDMSSLMVLNDTDTRTINN
jgi:E3 ubiquitin-protein ligase DOA10